MGKPFHWLSVEFVLLRSGGKKEWEKSVVIIIMYHNFTWKTGVLIRNYGNTNYWYRVKKRMSEEERSELSTFCRQLKLTSSDGKKI